MFGLGILTRLFNQVTDAGLSWRRCSLFIKSNIAEKHTIFQSKNKRGPAL